MENEIPLAMMVRHRVREPTLTQIQRNVEKEKFFTNKPAWLRYAESHPGLPEHYLTLNALESSDLPELPFQVNREIFFKMIIVPQQSMKKFWSLPRLIDIRNGSIVITGPELSITSKSFCTCTACCFLAATLNFLTSSQALPSPTLAFAATTSHKLHPPSLKSFSCRLRNKSFSNARSTLSGCPDRFLTTICIIDI